jgi:hypothetical protein
MVSWGQIGAALFEGTAKGLENAAVSEDKRIGEEKKLYEAQAEAARQQAEENKGKYTKQVGDFTSRMKQISGSLLDVEGGVDKKTADKLAYNLVKTYGLDSSSFSNLQRKIDDAKSAGSSLYAAEALKLALNPNVDFNLDDAAKSIAGTYVGYDKLKPPDSSYTMPWLFGGGKPKSLDTAARTADARGSGLMSPKDVDDSGYPKIDITPPVTLTTDALEKLSGPDGGPSKVVKDAVKARQTAYFNNPDKQFSIAADKEVTDLMVAMYDTHNQAANAAFIQNLWLQNADKIASLEPAARKKWEDYFSDLTLAGSATGAVNIESLKKGHARRKLFGDGRVFSTPSQYATYFAKNPKSAGAKLYKYTENGTERTDEDKARVWKKFLKDGWWLDTNQLDLTPSRTVLADLTQTLVEQATGVK